MIEKPSHSTGIERDFVVELLVRLSQGCRSFFVYKHADDAMRGRGDADCFICHSEFRDAEGLLLDVARQKGLSLWAIKYRPDAETFFFVRASTDSKAEMVAEIDLNWRPAVRFLTWLRERPSSVLVIHGARIASEIDEGMAAILYYYVGNASAPVPERERKLLGQLEREEWTEIRNRVRRIAFPFGVWCARRIEPHRIGGLRKPSSRIIANVLALITALIWGPKQVADGVFWRVSGRYSTVQVFVRRFVKEARRSIKGVGGYSRFCQLIIDAGGRMIV